MLNSIQHLEPCETIDEAFEGERQIKNWKRQWKIDLIEKNNPKWLDLFDNLVKGS